MIESIKNWLATYQTKQAAKKLASLEETKQSIIDMVVKKEKLLAEGDLPKEAIDDIYRDLERCLGEGLGLKLVDYWGRFGAELQAKETMLELIKTVEEEIGRPITDKQETLEMVGKL